MATLKDLIVQGSARVVGDLFAGTITEGGTTLANKYLGKTAQAADSAKLGGTTAASFATKVKIGTAATEYSASSNLITLPAYPTSLPANGGTSTTTNRVNIVDVRGEQRLPSYFTEKSVTCWFNTNGTPTSAWYSGIHLKGWTAGYQSWEIASGSTTSLNGNLYYRNGIDGTWQDWKRIAFASEIPTTLPASDVSAWAKKSSLAASDVPTLAISKIDGLQTALDGKQAAITSSNKLAYSLLSGTPTIPATNVIPAQTTANKVLLSTTTSGTAAWSSWNTAGFLKTNASGVVSIDTNTYLTGNQTITLSGDIEGSGTTSITTTIGAGKVTNAMLAGSIANGKLANSSMTIAGTSVSLGGSITAATIGAALTSSAPAAYATSAGSVAWSGVTEKPLSSGWTGSSSNLPSETIVTNYVASRGQNLLSNGTAFLGTNFNFPNQTYDGSKTYYGGGSFKYTSLNGMWFTTEYMPVDVNDEYVLSYSIMCDRTDARFYDIIDSYDIDKNRIYAYHIMWISGSTTTLARELKNGDTVVYLTSVAGFNKNTTLNYLRGFIFWDYKNTRGYQYPTETYSRNVYTNRWADASAFNASNNTITLSSPWTGGTHTVGTPVSQCSDGGNYIYLNSNFTCGTANTWIQKVGRISGVGKNNAGGKFREGTAFVKIGFLCNRDITGACNTWWSTLTFSNDRATHAEITTVQSYFTNGVAKTATLASTVTVGTGTSDVERNIVCHNGDSLYSTSGITMNYSKKSITATTFKGNLTGDVTGNVSGSSGSCTGNAATSSKLTDLNSADSASSSATWRKVWMSYADGTTGRPALSDSLVFQTSTGTLKATVFQGDLSGGAVSGTTGSFSSNVSVGGTLSVTGAASFGTGVNLTEAKYIQFRPNNTGYYTTMRYDTAGNEALILGMKNSVTSLIVKSGDSGTTATTTTTWTSITPSLQVKGQCVYINELIANGSTGAYNLKVNGTACITGSTTLSSTLSVTGSITSQSGISAIGVHDFNISTGSDTAIWGNIEGTLSEQTDLNNALNAKQDVITSSNKLSYSLLKDTPAILSFGAWQSAGTTSVLTTLKYRKYGNVVYFKGRATNVAFTANQSSPTTLFTLPEGYRPVDSYFARIVGYSFGSTTAAFVEITISSAGVVQVYPVRYNGGVISAAQTVHVVFDNLFFFTD